MTYHLWSSFFMLVCCCEISQMFDTSSMIVVILVVVFQWYKLCPLSLTYYLWSWFCMFVCSKVKYCHTKSATQAISISKRYGSIGIPKITKYNQRFPDTGSAVPYIHFCLGIGTTAIVQIPKQLLLLEYLNQTLFYPNTT